MEAVDVNSAIKTVYVLVEISIAPWLTVREQIADHREFATLHQCKTSRPDVGVYGALDQRVIVCRRVHLKR